ncbi:hypothetical protein ACQY0O_004650 [Thecaphora frezii]
MENPMLKATAQPFQPGKPPAARTSSFQNPPPPSGAPNGRTGAPGGFLPPHVLSQIQNQMTGGLQRQGGLMPMPMNAQSRPFVPGMPGLPPPQQPQQQQQQQHGPLHHPVHPPQQQMLQPQPSFQPSATSPILSRPIPPRLGHAMNPGSVQLTGLQTFLGGPGGLPLSISPNSPAHHLNGPVSPMTPGVQAPGPFMFPPGQGAIGPQRGGKHRKGRGPAPITPLKTTGHNSTPSVSLNPAAFAASLAAAKAKKKVVVTIPKEGPLPEDNELLSRPMPAELDPALAAADEDEDEAEEKRTERIKLRAAKEAAEIRRKWILREPLDQIDLEWSDEMPEEAMVTCAIHPEPWPTSLGLPDTIDIYLPGLSAWDEYQEIRAEEKAQAEAEALAEAQLSEVNKGLTFGHAWSTEPSIELGLETSAAGRSKSMSLCSPSDVHMANFRLNRYLTAQESAEGDPNLPSVSSSEAAKASGMGRFQEGLPLKLREAFAKRQAEGQEAKARTGSGHGYTMSLGMPSSGGPFGPAALSALEMIRANSDAGPTEPALGDRPVPEKEISEPDLSQRRSSESSLAGIDEAGEEESESEEVYPEGVAKPTGWKELARGFGYDPDNEEMEATPQMPPLPENGVHRRHSRQASRISVSTSRRGGAADGQEAENELDEVRTNPSEDADASDFEEEIESEAEGAGDGRHWSRRSNGRKHDFASGQKHRGGGYYDDLSDMSDDNLQDSLTPSDEQFSNPSDEEAAREERLMRRQHRAALRAARHETRRRRARSGTNNTLPSSSIGEGDVFEQSLTKQSGWSHHAASKRPGHQAEQDVISNPSDEVQSDFDERGTFGGPLDHGHVSGDRLSQDFRFPPPQHVERRASQHNETGPSPFQFKPPQAETLGRVSGSYLNPGAKEFSFGRPNGAGSWSAHGAQDRANGAGGNGYQPHFRLPSINNSSFGSSTFGDVVSHAQPSNNHLAVTSTVRPGGLNAAAPSFTPGAFTFTAPGAPRMEMPADVLAQSHGVAITVEHADGEERGAQGREKRQKFGPIDNLADDDGFLRPASPPRLKGSTASIEGPMRDFSSFSRRGPPPFDASGLAGQRAASGSRFKADAPVFTPSWGRSASTGASRRPALPDFGFGAIGDPEEAQSPSNFFAFSAASKAIPIRKPDDDQNKATSEQQPQQLQPRLSGVSASRKEADVPSNEADLARRIARDEGGMVGSHRTSGRTTDGERTPLASIWERTKAADRTDIAEYGRSPPVDIPRPPAYNHRSMALPLPIDTMSKKQRMIHKHTLSRDSAAMSEDNRQRRNVPHAHQGSFDTDDESLTDFIEELAERMDKALEGWAGKILDEVTIMGQVRPVHRPGSDALDKEQMIEAFSRRVENLMDFYVSKVEKATASRPGPDGMVADDSQTTIKAIDAAQRQQGLDTLDAVGELDFDYVQEILDVKMQKLKEELQRTFTESLGMLKEQDETHDEGEASDSILAEPQALTLSAETSEQLATLLSSRLSSALRDHSRQQEPEFKEQLSALLESALEEHATRSQNKAAADRLEIAHQVADQLKGNVDEWNRSFGELRSSFGDHVQMALINGVIPHLETLRTEPVNGDVIAARVTEILVPMLSDERERRRAERKQSEELVRSPSFSAEAVADETLSKLIPIISSLKSEPVDSDALVERLGEVIGKQSIEHLVDLSPVIALLEPIIAKQEVIRSFTKKMIERQDEVERTMSELPGAINAKTEIFLSAAGQTQDVSSTILSHVQSLHELHSKSLANQDRSEKEDELADQLQRSRAEAGRLGTELEAARSELSKVKDDHSSTRVEFAKLEGKLHEAERNSAESLAQIEAAKTKEVEALEKALETDKKLQQANAAARETELAKDAAVKEAAMLKAHMEQLAIELNEARAERAREREMAAQATAEALARAERAERQAVEADKQANDRIDASISAERKAQEGIKEAVERAAKAEGQVSTLEKRVADQDAKIANLQALAAAQKQKTAMNQQKLSEAEKRTKDFDIQAKELAVATARLEELEDRVKDDEDLRDRLREAQDGEAVSLGRDLEITKAPFPRMRWRQRGRDADTYLRPARFELLLRPRSPLQRLREEVAQYHARFSELEKDLITMKESLVGRDELEACQAELAQSREEVARLKGRLIERERIKPDGWVEVSAPAVGASMHAPKKAATPKPGSEQWSNQGLGQDTGGSSTDTSVELSRSSGTYPSTQRPAAHRTVSMASSVLREVEQDDGGWWS